MVATAAGTRHPNISAASSAVSAASTTSVRDDSIPSSSHVCTSARASAASSSSLFPDTVIAQTDRRAQRRVQSVHTERLQPGRDGSPARTTRLTFPLVPVGRAVELSRRLDEELIKRMGDRRQAFGSAAPKSTCCDAPRRNRSHKTVSEMGSSTYSFSRSQLLVPNAHSCKGATPHCATCAPSCSRASHTFPAKMEDRGAAHVREHRDAGLTPSASAPSIVWRGRRTGAASPAGMTRKASPHLADMQRARPSTAIPYVNRPTNLRELAIAANQCTHDIVVAEMRLATKDLARREAVRLMQTADDEGERGGATCET